MRARWATPADLIHDVKREHDLSCMLTDAMFKTIVRCSWPDIIRDTKLFDCAKTLELPSVKSSMECIVKDLLCLRRRHRRHMRKFSGARKNETYVSMKAQMYGDKGTITRQYKASDTRALHTIEKNKQCVL